MERVFSENIDKKFFCLSEDESKHLTLVLRKKKGDKIEICDGKGMVSIGKIIEASKKRVKVETIERRFFNKKIPEIDFYISAIPSDKLELSIQKLTEIGVSKIIIFFSERSKIKDYKNTNKKVERLKKIAISAIKQSKNPYLPEILIKEKLEKDDFDEYDLKIILRMDGNFLEKSRMENVKKVSVVVGPEGDFTDRELDFFKDLGFYPLRIAPFVLRSETAIISGCAILRYIFSERAGAF